jgi:Mrp family chromosome partitioning ATPase
MAPLQYLKVIRRRWWIVLACFLLATVTGYILSPEQSAKPEGPGFQANVTLVPPSDVASPPNLYLAAHLTTSPDVAALAEAQLPPDVRPSNEEAIAASVSPEAGAVTVTATDLDKNSATLLAQAYATATIEFIKTATVGSQEGALAAAKKELKTVEGNIEDLRDDLARDPSNAVVEARLQTEMARFGMAYQRVQELLSAEKTPATLQVLGAPEVAPIEASGISPPDDRRARALLAGALGLVLGFGVAIVVDRLDPRLRERAEVEEALGLPVLGEIPRVGRRARADHALITTARPDSAAAEAYRSLRSALTLVAQGGRSNDGGAISARPVQPPSQVLVVTGARGHEGKTTTVVNLAAAFAEMDRNVIVIDCDFRKPEAHLYLDASPGGGLADMTDGYLNEVIRTTSIPGVTLVTSGRAISQPASVLPRLAGIIADARRQASIVLIDSSPLLVVSEAVVLTGTGPKRGTPYGQPGRKQALRSYVANWAQAASQDLGYRASRNGESAAAPTEDLRTDVTPEVSEDAARDDSVQRRHDQAMSDEAPQDQAPQDRAPQDRAPQDRAPQDRAPQDQAPQDQAPQDQQPANRQYKRRHERPNQWPAEWYNGGEDKRLDEYQNPRWHQLDGSGHDEPAQVNEHDPAKADEQQEVPDSAARSGG